jgi:hypothetical protein
VETRISPYGDLVASALVTAAGAFSGKVEGFSGAPVKLASVYTLTLAPGSQIDPSDAEIVCTVFQLSGVAITAASFGGIGVVQSADNTIAVSTFSVAGAAADRGFMIGVFRKAVAL